MYSSDLIFLNLLDLRLIIYLIINFLFHFLFLYLVAFFLK